MDNSSDGEMEIDDLSAGKAGEYLVCADLILKGHIAFPSEQGLPYDVVADINGRLLRVQVKTTRGPRNVPQRATRTSAYLFWVSRCGKGGMKSYGETDADLFALVALDARCVGYLSAIDAKRTMIFRSPLLRGQYADEVNAQLIEDVHSDKASGLRNFEIADKRGLDRSTVSRILLRPNRNPRTSPYLDSLKLDDALTKCAANDNIEEKKCA